MGRKRRLWRRKGREHENRKGKSPKLNILYVKCTKIYIFFQKCVKEAEYKNNIDVVYQGEEPAAFTKVFSKWNAKYWAVSIVTTLRVI